MVVGENGIIRRVNRAMKALTGYGSSELVGNPCTVLKCDVCEIMKAEARTKWCRLFEDGFVQGKRCLFMRKDGSYASVIKEASRVMDEAEGSLYAVETFSDLSELDRKELTIKELSRSFSDVEGFQGIIGRHPRMTALFQLIEKAAESDAPVLILGESGTGKELVARAVHSLGRRREGPFVEFNCAALNEALLESELFGHAKGAFTGAYRHRIGRFEAAKGGDIFLDEIGEMPISSQAKLLRVLETKQFERVGDNRVISADVRIITATNKPIEELVAASSFRQDLYYRISVFPIHVPPLRERREDIPLLVEHFLRYLSNKFSKDVRTLSQEIMNLFMNHAWPGNVRELKGCLEYAFVLAESGKIEAEHLPPGFLPGYSDRTAQLGGDPESLKERRELVTALRQAGGNRSVAARILGIHRMTVWNRMKRYGIKVREFIE